jgi:hypothetical protein
MVRADRDVPEQAESHRAVPQRVMSRRPHGAHAAGTATIEGAINGIQHAARGRGRGGPRTLTDYRVGIDMDEIARRGQVANRRHVFRQVGQSEISLRRVPSLEMFDRLEDIGSIAQRAGDGPEPSDVLGVAPAGVVPPAVGMRDEGSRP